MKKLLLLATAMGFSCIATQAQVWITDGPLDMTGVSNEGIAVGTPGRNTPFFLWNPQENTYTNIGGISADNGIGGVARLSADGKYVAAPAPFDAIPQYTEWQKTEYGQYSNVAFKGICHVSDYIVLAYGTSAEGEPVILKTANNGRSWINNNENVGAQIEAGIETVANMSLYMILAGCQNGKLYLGSGNGAWQSVSVDEVRPAGDESIVKTWKAIDFLGDVFTSQPVQYGVFGVELEDGGYAVWQTSDHTETFTAATGVAGVPMHITHVGDVYYMVTENGYIQKSDDKGLTWTNLFDTKGSCLYHVRFADAQKGIATSDNIVYITLDGGETWKQAEVLPAGLNPLGDENVVWNDAVWNADELVVIGSKGLVYSSKDDGKTFVQVDLKSEESGNIGAISHIQDRWNLLSSSGNFYTKTDAETMEGYGSGIYDVEKGTWTSLSSLGYDIQNVVSSPYNFTEDGRFITGGIYNFSKQTNTVQSHAALFDGTGKVIDLGSKYEYLNRASKALASSIDGSVVVGWQDIFGPRYGAVWRKTEQGDYSMKMLLKDPAKSEDDFDPETTPRKDFYENFIGEARAVSADGKWIGGAGRESDQALHGPWIWSEETGYQVLFEEQGAVADFSSDGSVAVGWKYLGQNAWMWTKEKGVQDLNKYAREVLGQDLGNYIIMSVYDISPNGRFITGYCLNGDEMHGYVMDLKGSTANEENKIVDQVKVSTYPNPVSDVLHVDMTYSAKEVETTLTLTDIQGRVIEIIKNAQASEKFDVSGLPCGIYFLEVNATGYRNLYKIAVNH